jgi:hypothetical protein
LTEFTGRTTILHTLIKISAEPVDFGSSPAPVG